MGDLTWTATAADPGDAGHLLPEDVWAQVVRDAEAASLPSVGVGAADRTITARSHGGVMAGGPRLGVLHSAETPLTAGYAYSISANWFAAKASTSAHLMIDPRETIKLLPDNVVAYAVGPRANGFTYNIEQAGYARFSVKEWTTAEGMAQMRRVATEIREVSARWGLPLRWATDAQIKAAAAGRGPQGWCTHADIARVLGGTTHTDPLPHYPLDQLMALAAGGIAPTPVEDDDMTPETAVAIGETRWLAGQMKEAVGLIFTILQDEDAQTDRLEWGLLDETQGARTQIAGIAGQLAGFGELIRQSTGGGALDLAAITEASAAGTRAVMSELAAAVGSVGRPRTARADLHTKATELLARWEAGPTAEELHALVGDLPSPS